MENLYDLVIIGSGPAGLSTGLYAARSKMKVLMLEKDKNGGQIVVTHLVENYPGSIEDCTGPKLVARMVEQCKNFGVEMVKDEVVDVNFDGDIKEIVGRDNTYKAKAVVIASGANPRKIGCPGEAELTGKGVSYCATCDADFFEDFEVFVVGGGDSAIEEALYLTKFARKVTIIHRRQGFRCNATSLEKARKNPKIEWMLDTVVEEIKGDGIVESFTYKNKITGEVGEYFADEEDGTMGIFVFIGFVPQTEVYKDKVNLDESGYIITDEDMRTNVEGVFAAGDIRQKSLRQVVTAAADGAIAAVTAEKYIDEKFES